MTAARPAIFDRTARQSPFAAKAAAFAERDCCAIRLPVPAPLLAAITPAAPAEASRAEPLRRRRIWELSATLHCSIIGTCLSADELRRLLRKLGLGAPDATDHALHGIGVGLAARQEQAARLLNKALDERHRLALRRFAAATDRESVRRLWRKAVEAGDIPGAYWAVLTHPATDERLVAEAFGDVHMLSHLVGAANRADIRRLAEQEREIAALRETVARQQARLRDDLTERGARIRALQDLLAKQSLQDAVTTPAGAAEVDALLAELRGRLDRETRRRESLERRAQAAEASLREERAHRSRLERDIGNLGRELSAAELALGHGPDAPCTTAPDGVALGTVLYVGGRTGQTSLLRDAALRCGVAEFLHHGAEQGSALLPGLVHRADLVVFPVECVSHDAAQAVKRLCQQAGKRFLPLRSAGATSLIVALRAAASTGEGAAHPGSAATVTPRSAAGAL